MSRAGLLVFCLLDDAFSDAMLCSTGVKLCGSRLVNVETYVHTVLWPWLLDASAAASVWLRTVQEAAEQLTALAVQEGSVWAGRLCAHVLEEGPAFAAAALHGACFCIRDYTMQTVSGATTARMLLP